MLARQAGARVRKLREMRGLTREAMCGMVGIETRALGNYETGLRMIPPHEAAKVADLFSVNLDYIYRGVTDTLPFKIAQELLADRRN